MKKLTIFLILFITSFNIYSQDSLKVKSFEETITPYVEKILNGLEQGVEYASQEIPVVIKQYLLFQSIKHGICTFGLPLLIFLLCCIFNKVLKKNDQNYPNGIIHIANIFGLMVFLGNIMGFIKVTFFPKLYLLEKFINLI